MEGLGLEVVGEVVEGDPVVCLAFEIGMQDVHLVQMLEVLDWKKFHYLFEVCVCVAACQSVDVEY